MLFTNLAEQVNDYMGIHVADQMIQLMLMRKLQVADSRILMFALEFKETVRTCALPVLLSIFPGTASLQRRDGCPLTLGRRK